MDDASEVEASTTEPELTALLHAMSDPQRLAMLKALADDGWHPCGAGDWGAGLHKSTVSHHVGILRDAGLLETRKIGRNKHGRLRRSFIDARFPGLLDGVLPNA